ncbi:MAG: DUF1919 domain-containing protein [Lachnoclostridium sp.]|nr:DUF1919 domain-containing protein [Lachnoclostridium sp.]
MVKGFKLLKVRLLRPWNRFIRRRRLKNKTVTVISNNCWGGFMMKECGMAFYTPFVGLFMFDDDYIRMLEDMNVLSKPLRFISREQSRHVITEKKDYPIGVIGDGIEIHFLHYKSAQEAAEKWAKRVSRIDKDNMIVKFGDEDGWREDLMRRFEALPFDCKVCFTAQEHEGYPSVVRLPYYDNEGSIQRDAYKVTNDYWDFVDHANALKKTSHA